MNLTKIGALTLLAALTLTGCGDNADADGSSTPSGGPEVTGHFSSVTQLRDYAIKLGYPCPNWQQTNSVDLAAESGSCSDSDVFAIYDSNQVVADQLKEAEKITFPIGPWAIGENWTINAHDQDFLAKMASHTPHGVVHYFH